MNIKLISKGSTGEVLLEGRLDANSSPEAEQIMRELMDRFENLTLDLAGLDYISSAGLRVIKVVHVTLKKKGGSLTIRHAGKRVMEVFEMTGFAGILNFENGSIR